MRRHLPLPEFVALMGVTFATVAFSIDAMLPAMGDIAAELTPDTPNAAQLVITSFVLGMGIGTLFTGPLSDRFGRRPVILFGSLVYGAGALLAWAAPTLETVLAARILQGLGAAAPRVAALAIVRDLYSGRKMAQVMSFAMIVFTIVPALAPLGGSIIIAIADWRAIFLAFVVFSLVTVTWLGLRQAETLPRDARRPFSATALASGTMEILRNTQVMLVVMILSLVFGALFATISTTQQVFDQAFDRADSFPYWFAGVALLSGLGSLLNARVVIRVGMRRVVALTLCGQLAISLGLMLALLTGALAGDALFYAFAVWLMSVFMMAGLTIGNLNALGMEPLGHLAGLGASVIGSISTLGAVVIAVPIGLAFDGTALPVVFGTALCCIAALLLMRHLVPVEQTA